ncbi:hypothetical protein [Natrinema pallidum]|uniref:Uncharacterized protein n=1 Tax=Natrinema pallidum TaxID=69527 RepID=A0A4P9TDA9_9EURY|nr:hypothetical protein [Natrinema pallidum]QCW01742.1 hypothetical protein FGF80_00100 [Natrinema pallidum]
MTTVSVDGKELTIGETTVTLRHPIKETVRVNDVVVVLLDVPIGTIDNQNVIAFSKNGDRLWEIEPISDDPTADQAYVNIYINERGVWVVNPIGARCRVDVETGILVEKEITR